MRLRLLCSVLMFISTALGQTTRPTTKPAPTAPSELRESLAIQIALEREGFSPGLVDGKIGGKTRSAIECYQESHGLKATGRLDENTGESLKVDPSAAVADYAVTAADLERITPFTEDWNERAKQDWMGYYDVFDALAERFHTSKAMLQRLNPATDFGKVAAGDKIVVPALGTPAAIKAASLKIDLAKKQIHALDSGGKSLAMFHCSIAAKAEKRPAGQTTVVTVIRNPDYTFDPEYWPEVKNVTRRLLISPGPRNPVGLAWIGLGLPGYGIHGTPHPEMIGKTGSHGCFRMTNWDAIRLTGMIRAGAAVTFVD